MVSKFDDEVDVDNYESVVDIAAARDESDDSDSEQFASQKPVQNVDTNKDRNMLGSQIAPEVAKDVESPGDDFEDFLNDDECDNSVKSLHTDYETL